ncbi:unnamed protein product, partial [Effrenium voratum]
DEAELVVATLRAGLAEKGKAWLQQEAISVPWTPSLGVGGRLSSDLSACYVACAANMCACGLAAAQGKLEVAMHAAWLVGVVGDPVYRPCRVCGTKINPDTGKCKRADTSSCPSQPDLALKVLATAHIADWSGAVENVLIRGEQLAALASVDDEAKLAELIAEKGTQALCFKGPFDVRLATAPNMTQGRSARRPAETTQVDASQTSGASQTEAGVPAEASQFQLLDDPDIREVDINGDKHLVTSHHVVPFPEIDGAKPFAVEAFCHFKNCHLFNMADGAPRLLVGKPIQDCDTDLMTCHVEWMARANDDVVRSVVAERDTVCHLLGMKPELASKMRTAEMLVARTPSKVTCSSWSDGS